ncbi:DUF2637 domain-containing protein [Streptomyces sp. NPDC058619]|uniref:DUF2637 domain-containing protein n=1 Tax=unclassified Streptomyces TaxID=2593676 RepID=UPI003662827A
MDWDPAEELAHLLHEAVENERNGTAPPADTAKIPVIDGSGNNPLGGLTKITAGLPPLSPTPPRGRRRPRSRKRAISALRTTSFFLAALAAIVVSMVCVFSGMVSYDPLRHIAQYPIYGNADRWWPLLVYGPWLVASLSILRAALHRRRVVHSWAVVLLFSTVSMLLCVAQAPRTLVDVAAAALPALASLTCFQQLVRQITLTRPPLQTKPRHRTRPTPPQRPTGQRPA